QCRFAISDFASTEQSERLLQNLKPDIVRLKTDLIERISRSRNEEALKRLAALTESAQKNGALIIASNVSTPQQMASIWQYGASMAQGSVVQDPSETMDFDFSQFFS
ncbi:MAG: EAL domain-containing protein, partial [Candidatus Competibacteraceae bacterium]|nr:EAL domain-containing protein [Candidatus Competibacteraceae bacterium]